MTAPRRLPMPICRGHQALPLARPDEEAVPRVVRATRVGWPPAASSADLSKRRAIRLRSLAIALSSKIAVGSPAPAASGSSCSLRARCPAPGRRAAAAAFIGATRSVLRWRPAPMWETLNCRAISRSEPSRKGRPDGYLVKFAKLHGRAFLFSWNDWNVTQLGVSYGTISPT